MIMKLSGLCGGQYRPLSEDDIKTIHDASLKILERTGIGYEPGLEKTAAMLEKAGAAVDHDGSRIRFPRTLIEEQAAKAPEKVVLCGRAGEDDLVLDENRVHMGTGGAAIRVLDLETGIRRASTLNDIYEIGRLVDRLDHIHFYVRPCIPTDIPPSSYDVNVFYACMKATHKHVMAGVNDIKGLHDVIELASMVGSDRERLRVKPFISIIASFAISPLKLDTAMTIIMQEAIRNHVPVALSAAPMSGSTSPMTMAGTLAQLHAEQLAGICICQLTNPGAPVLYGGIPGMANLRSMGYLGGAVECGMMNAAVHQLAHHVRVPNYNSSGLSDSKLPDAQAGWEKALTTLLAAMGGSNYVHHSAGMLESMLTVAYEQFIIDDEIIGMCCKVLKGIDVDAEHLAVEVIETVGPGGNFMMSPHTMANIRKEYFQGNGVSDQRSMEKWEEDGSRDARERARAIARKMLSGEKVSCIPEEVDQVIRERFEILL